MQKYVLIAAMAAALWWFTSQDELEAVTLPDGSLSFPGYTFANPEPFDLQARVLSVKDYRSGREADLKDLQGVGHGPEDPGLGFGFDGFPQRGFRPDSVAAPHQVLQEARRGVPHEGFAVTEQQSRLVGHAIRNAQAAQAVQGVMPHLRGRVRKGPGEGWDQFHAPYNTCGKGGLARSDPVG